ncbi:MAG TPA: sigma-70 family RNA polymerase sigma factor [Tepidisphaeraceae bacterium]
MIDLISHPTDSASDGAAPTPGVFDSSTPWNSVSTAMVEDARELLSRFATTGEQDPFEEVVRRYGGMVYNLCFEVTGNRHDAEDAVQAAFMSLALQVRSGQQIQAIGPWLQQVARRMSLDINRSRKRRKNREERHAKAWENRMTDLAADGAGGAGTHGNPSSAAGWEELRHIVQAELNELPAKYRMPLILHYYGGLSRDEMARELNCKANTLGVRLHRGREMLGKRLAKRGIALSAAMFGLVMAEVVRSVVSQRLVEHTAQAAVLVSCGHPFACGVVSPQIVAMAHTASRALANAKLRLAATLALLAGGAAAAGAQVVSGGAIWSNLPRPSNWDLGRAFRWIFHPPTFHGPVAAANPTKSKEPAPGAAPGTIEVAGTGSPKRTAVAQPSFVLPQLDPLSLMPLPRGSAPSVASSWYPPVTRVPQGDSPLPFPPNSAYVFHLNPGFAAPGNGGGGGGSTGSGGGAAIVAGNDAGGGSSDKPAGGDGGSKSGNPNKDFGLADRTPGNRGNDSRPTINPGRGGVKQPGGGVPNPFDFNHDVPDRSDPGEIVRHPVPGGPSSPAPSHGPIMGPVVPSPDVPPGKPTEDAEHGGGPSAPANGGGQGHGGFLSDQDDLYISTPLNSAGAESFDSLVAGGRGNANFQLGPGESLTSKQVLVGYQGAGVAAQSGGVHTADSLYLGVMKGSRGRYALSGGGELRVTASPGGPDSPVHSVEIGGAGEGVLLLGDASSTGQITQGGVGAGVDMTVGATRSSKGTLRGWGQVGLTGVLTNDGQVIADGYGQDRSLDLSSFATVTNSLVNTGNKGWYAVNQGRLDLPAMAVTQGSSTTVTWGQNNDDDLTFVNAARFTFHDVQKDSLVKVALLSLDRGDIPTLPQGHHFIGVWSFDAGAEGLGASGGADVLVRYDDALAAEKGLDENVLKLWKYVDGQWERLDHDPTFVRDPLGHTLFVRTDWEGVSYFAVSAPEPATWGLVGIGLGMLGMRRRRGRRL